MLKKTIGSVLMILGTAVGAGMLALPLATAHADWQITLLMMLFSWGLMTVGALAVLEVNLWFPSGTNLISMVDKTLGRPAKAVTWVVYLMLLYSLLCAYLSGGSDVLHGLFQSAHVDLPRWSTTVLSLVVLGSIVTGGIGTIDVVNRGLMSVKLLAYIILVLVIAPHITVGHINAGEFTYKTSTLMVMITSFGFAIIVPTLRAYLESHAGRLKKVVLIGSLLPLIIYLIWIGVVQGLIARSGLMHMAASSEPNSLLMQKMSLLLDNNILGAIAKIFISICVVTSFLGVSICLVDFIADGIQRKKDVWVYVISFLPPLIIVLLAPGIFIKALSYAGVCCVYLLILLPALMLYSGRYIKKLKGIRTLPDVKVLILLCILIGILLMLFEFYA